MFITLDQNYSVNEYNQFLENLRQNTDKNYTKHVYYKNPYNIYLNIDFKPLFVKCEVLPKEQEKNLIAMTVPCTPDEENQYRRRQTGKQTLNLCLNDWSSDIQNSEHGYLFYVMNKEELSYLSQNIGKVYYLGRYYDNKYRICSSTSKYLLDYLPEERILSKKTKKNTVFDMELEINLKVLYLRDKLHKYARTPYYENGKYVIPTALKQDKSKFVII